MPTATGIALRALRAVRLAPRPGSAWRPRPAGPHLPQGRDRDGLTPWQAAKAQRRLDALRPADRQLVEKVLAAGDAEWRAPVRRALAAGQPAAEVLDLGRHLAGKPSGWMDEHLRLVDAGRAAQHRFGVAVDQVDDTTCGSTVLLVLAAQSDPRFALELTEAGGFGDRFDDLQRAVHRQSNRVWPRALGTSPWGMVAWLRRHAPAAGPYRVRLVDDSSPGDLAGAMGAVEAALDTGTAVPLLVGGFLPRHYALALCRTTGWDAGWRVFEPTSGEVRTVDPEAVRQHRLAPVLGFDHLHAALLPAA